MLNIFKKKKLKKEKSLELQLEEVLEEYMETAGLEEPKVWNYAILLETINSHNSSITKNEIVEILKISSNNTYIVKKIADNKEYVKPKECLLFLKNLKYKVEYCKIV